jgi:hypothetical protein
MRFRLFTAGTAMLCAALLHAQTEAKPTSETAAAKEAERQARVALDPNAQQSPNQSMAQAVAFERYKEMAAEREAQKEASAQTAENARSRVKHAAATRK